MSGRELTRVVHLHDLADGPVELRINVDEASRSALAERFGLDSLMMLNAQVMASRHGRGLRVEGHFSAQPVQRCVVTGKAVVSNVAESFTVVFLPEIAEAEAAGNGGIDVEATEDYEPLTSDRVDVGEVVAQSLALALDPYPRSAEACPVGEGGFRDDGDKEDEEPDTPFAVLKNLRDMT